MACILIVDGYPVFRETMEFCLPRFGYTALSAADEPEARAQALAHPIDLVLLDVGLPDCHGLEICASIARDPQLGRVPIIVLSGIVTAELTVRAREAGAAELLAKPFRWDQLLAAVARLLPGN